MTREDFMRHAENEIEQAFRGQKNRMMNLVEQAWAEGKRNAEKEYAAQIGKDFIEEIRKSIVMPWKPEITVSDHISEIPDACKNCSNHPSNGGSGICHCTLGSMTVN